MAKLETFTAKMQRPGQPARFIPNAVIYKGYVVGLFQKGVGKSWEEGGFTAGGDGDTWIVWEKYEDAMRPYFDGAKVTAEIKSTLQKCETVEAIFAAGLQDYMLKFGEQDGYTITSREAEESEKQRQHDQSVAEKKIPISVTFGYFGLRIAERLPATDWQQIKSLAEYHRGDETDLEWLDDQGHIGVKALEVRGWYYQNSVISLLTGMGYTMQYSGKTITNSDELLAIEREQRRLDNEHYARVKKIKSQSAQWRNKIISLAREAGICSKQEAELASNLPRIKILSMQGPDIYGGGAWLHIDGDDLFYVRNNGMDGDDWSYNNYATGGAGAICYRIPGAAGMVEEIRAWVNSLGQYSIYAEE